MRYERLPDERPRRLGRAVSVAMLLVCGIAAAAAAHRARPRVATTLVAVASGSADDDAGAPSLVSAELTTNCSALMPMRMTLSFRLSGVNRSAGGATYRLAAEYRPSSETNLSALWTTTVATDALATCDGGAEACGSLDLYRVRASAPYDVSLWLRADVAPVVAKYVERSARSRRARAIAAGIARTRGC